MSDLHIANFPKDLADALAKEAAKLGISQEVLVKKVLREALAIKDPQQSLNKFLPDLSQEKLGDLHGLPEMAKKTL